MQFHPMLYVLVRGALRKALVAKGLGLPTAFRAAEDATPALVDEASKGLTVPPELATVPTSEPADKGSGGTIIAAILAFLSSPTGQQLIAALLALLGAH